MTEELVWSEATAADHADIRAFRCSAHKRGPDGELLKTYELEAEVGLQDELTFPLSPDEGVIIARDGIGVAAVSWWWHVRSDGQTTKLLVMAVAERWRRRRVGDSLMAQTVDRVLERADSSGIRTATIFASVRSDNEDCRKFMNRKGFWPDDDGASLIEWWLRVDLPGPEDEAR